MEAIEKEEELFPGLDRLFEEKNGLAAERDELEEDIVNTLVNSDGPMNPGLWWKLSTEQKEEVRRRRAELKEKEELTPMWGAGSEPTPTSEPRPESTPSPTPEVN